MKLPNPNYPDILILRISKIDKQKLQELSLIQQFGNNKSEVVRQLIQKVYKKHF